MTDPVKAAKQRRLEGPTKPKVHIDFAVRHVAFIALQELEAMLPNDREVLLEASREVAKLLASGLLIDGRARERGDL